MYFHIPMICISKYGFAYSFLTHTAADPQALFCLVTPAKWSRILEEIINTPSDVYKFPEFYATQMFIVRQDM